MLVTFSTPDLEWAASTVLAYGPLVTVLEPVELRTKVQEWAQAILALYQHPQIKEEEKENDQARSA